MPKYLAWPFALLQFVLPKHFLTAVVFHVARIRNAPLKDFLIRRFAAMYKVDVGEAERPVPGGYSSLNDFFTRSLADGARPIDSATASVVSPVDGAVSAAGVIESDMLLQAKGIRYSLSDLLMTDVADADRFANGRFVTLYLAPHNYHRVHSPLRATLMAARYVPGALYSVNEATVSVLPRLFTRNERLICHFASVAGPFILIFVGAMHVGSISTPWTGEIRPRRKGVVQDIDISGSDFPTRVEKGGLIGSFNMGSTVIVLFPPGVAVLDGDLNAGTSVTMGRPIATLGRDGV